MMPVRNESGKIQISSRCRKQLEDYKEVVVHHGVGQNFPLTGPQVVEDGREVENIGCTGKIKDLRPEDQQRPVKTQWVATLFSGA